MFSHLARRNALLSLCGEPAAGVDAERSEYGARRVLQAGSLPTETGIRRPMALSASLCAEGSALAAINAHHIVCAILLLLGVSAVAWSYCAESQAPDAMKRGRKVRTFAMAGSTIVASVVAVFLLASQPHRWVLAQTAADNSGYHTAHRTGGSPDDSYVSVILWPKQPQEVRVIAPPHRAESTIVVRLSKPLVILFDGVYWYLRSPAKTPGNNAHIAHGSPARIEIHSADWHPLIMEAHQRLVSPIDPRCCRELDLSIRNADNRPGAIRIAVELIDSSTPPVQSEDLGSRPVLSSMPPEFSLNRPPANEVLRYPIPASLAIGQFNEIEVVFLPARERSLGGAQIAIRSFSLLP